MTLSDNNLKTNSVGFPYLLAQSIALITPMGAAFGVLLGTASFAEGAFPLAILFAIVISLAWINTPYQFSKKLAGAGGFYQFAARAVSPSYGFYTGWFYMLNYFFFSAGAGVFLFGVIFPGVFSILGFGVFPAYAWIPLTILMVVLVFLLAFYGIRPSLKYSLVASVLEIGILIALSIGIIIQPTVTNTLSVFSPSLSPTGWSGVFLGAIFGFTALSGVSGAVYLGEEAKAPIKIMKKAILISYVVTAITFVLFSYAMTVGWGIPNMSTFASSGVPGLILSDQYLGGAFLFVMFLFVINSVFAGTLAPINASARLLFSMGRDKLVPGFLGKTSEKHQTPAFSLLTLSIVAVLTAVTAGVVLGPLEGFIFIILLAGVASLVGHILGSVALPLFFRKIKINAFYHVIVPAIYLATAIGIGYSLFFPFTYPVYYAPVIIIVWAFVGLLFLVNAKKKHKAWTDVGQPFAEEK